MTRNLTMAFAAMAGPLTWLTLLVVSWVVTPPAHIVARTGILRALHILALFVPIVAGMAAWREARRLSGIESREVLTERARFIAWGAFALSMISLLLVIGTALPTFLLSPGAEP